MIFGGTTNGDSNRANKRHSRDECLVVSAPKEECGRVLGFSPEDLRGIVASHNDVLVIRTIVANYEVDRVFIDADSSINILFKPTLEKIGLVERDLQHISIPLFGFFGHSAPAQPNLIISFLRRGATTSYHPYHFYSDGGSIY